MLRARLVSFGFGFAVAGAAISQLVWRDLCADRNSISEQMTQKFYWLEARVSMLESRSLPKSESAQEDVSSG